MRALERLAGTRIVALPGALDAAIWPEGALVLRLSPDEVFITPASTSATVNDPHAIVEPETGFSGIWLDHLAAIDFLERECDWELPHARPAFSQGLVAGLPVKVWFEAERVLFLVASPLASDFMERLR